MPRIGYSGSTVARTAAIAIAAVLGATSHAAGQAAADVSETDLQINLRVVSSSPGMSGEAGEFFTALGGLLSQLVGVDDANEIGKELDLPKPETSTMDYRVKIKGNRIRVDMGGSALLGRLAPDGTVSEWRVLDPKTNRVMNSWVFDQATRNAAVAFSAFPGEYEMDEPRITREAQTKTVQGYPVRRYSYLRQVHFYPAGKTTGAPELIAKLSGSAWLARFQDVPEADIALFFRLWADSFSGRSGPLAVDTQLAEEGLLLGSDDTTEVFLLAYDKEGSAELSRLMSDYTTTTVTDIGRPQLDPALFSGFEAPKKECDCSCDAYKEMQAIGKLPKEEIEKHPKAMAMAMCMPKCVQAYMACPKPN